MAFDFKKEYKELYMPKNKPEIEFDMFQTGQRIVLCKIFYF